MDGVRYVNEFAWFCMKRKNVFQDGSGAAPVLTDDVSLQVFMEHLKKLAVSSST